MFYNDVGDKMYKYYLFVIREEVADIYSSNLKELYTILYELQKGKFSNLNYRVSLFDQLCLPFKVNVISNYFKYLPHVSKNDKKYLYKFKDETSLLVLRYPIIVIISNSKIPTFFNTLNLYNKRILICDFSSNNYFWLSKNNNKIRSLEYN